MNGSAVFVMPYYGDGNASAEYLAQSVAGLHAQTDPGWRLVVVDDASPRPQDRNRLRELRDACPDRVHVIRQETNRGQGACRNTGVRWAADQGAEIILFQDADDLAHPRRLEVTRRILTDHPEADFVYSPFTVVDEHGHEVPEGRLTPSIREILHSHRNAPVEGADAWIRIGTETGYTSLTSTVSVRTALAVDHPFPEVRGSEDAHTWLRMSAGGTGFTYAPSIPGRYRIPQQGGGSSDRDRIGADYYRRKAEVDTDGFRQAVSIALRRGSIGHGDVPRLTQAFRRRLALTLVREGRHDLAAELLAGGSVPDTGGAAAPSAEPVR
ncbi:glycosyltransferase family 2 protein [Streptomyces sp. NPDC048603]|uniref:glycosyltransferase family 2 protein n=1 Tax=Streptomyces sp. NPDC048603 TaxID=3365577 RepID=UPI003720F06F